MADRGAEMERLSDVCKLFDKRHAPLACFWSNPKSGHAFFHIYASHEADVCLTRNEFALKEIEITEEFVDRILLAHISSQIAG